MVKLFKCHRTEIQFRIRKSPAEMLILVCRSQGSYCSNLCILNIEIMTHEISNRNEFDQNRSSIHGHFCQIDNVPITFIEMEKIEMQLMNSDFREIVLILMIVFIVCCSKPLLSSDQTFHLHFVVSSSLSLVTR